MFTPSPDQKYLLDKHLHLVLDANKHVNLTHIQTFNEGVTLHIQDSIEAVPFIQDLSLGDICDMGSGAGFPGIPLAICTHRNVTLVESIKKKAHALSNFVQNLQLDNVNVFPGRAEELALQHHPYEIVTARALSSLPSLIELASPLLSLQGIFIAYKSQDIAQELSQSQIICKKLGMSYVKEIPYTLGTTNEIKRSLVIFKKVSEPLVPLPRRSGMAQKRPYRK